MDGFRFDLASVLCRGTDGAPLNSPPLVKVLIHAYFSLVFYPCDRSYIESNIMLNVYLSLEYFRLSPH